MKSYFVYCVGVEMKKKLLPRLLGLGRFPAGIREEMESEGFLFLEEGIGLTITLKDYMDEVRRCSWKRRWCIGSIGATSRRLAAFAFSTRLLDLAMDDPLFGVLEIQAEDADCLMIGFDSSRIRKNTSGRVEYRFYFPGVTDVEGILKST